MPNLTDIDRQALRLAGDLQNAIQRWLSYRGVSQPCTVSPFVDPAGQPAVLVKMDAQMARAMIDGLGQPPALSDWLPSPSRTVAGPLPVF